MTPEQGADNSIYLASSPKVMGTSGKYFIKRKPAASSATSYDAGISRRLWELSADLVGLPMI